MPSRELGTYIFRAYSVMRGIGFFLRNICVHDTTINGRPLFKSRPCNAEHTLSLTTSLTEVYHKLGFHHFHMSMYTPMVPQTNHRHPCVFLAVNIYCLLVFCNAASSLHIEHGFERRADFDGATALTRTILLNVSSPSLIAATSICSILSQAVALLYHRELKQCYCLDERILPWSLRISSDLSWMYYEKPGYSKFI